MRGVVVRWPFWGGWGSRRDLVVWWCDVVCCGMSLAERSGAGGILEAVWWVARVEGAKLVKWSPFQIAAAVRSAMREIKREINDQYVSRQQGHTLTGIGVAPPQTALA